jgi:predicted TIM-barrel fold metal-dependent hydrolase
MSKKPNCPVIAIEEHYWDPELAAAWDAADRFAPPEMQKRLADLGDLRLKEMDEAGIDMQVISHGAPATQRLDAALAVELSRRVNDRLAAVVAANAKRFAAFGVLPTTEPDAAADELSRTVERLGFKGAMLHGMAHGVFLDDKRFWPIYARAEALDVPIYLHPATPHPAVMEIYYKDYAKDFPMVIRAAWGFTVETATLAVRLVLSGVFERHPKLKIVLGHFGETLPFFIWRIDQALKRPGQKPMSFRDIFCGHFYVTTSGNFSDPTLLCTMAEMGADRILFAIDWPFVANPPGVQWLGGAPISDDDKVKILSGNARKLLRI